MNPNVETAKMVIERDLEVPMDDGLVLRADVFRPETEEQVPVVMTFGPYGKGVKYQEGYKPQWEWLIGAHPDILEGSTHSFLTWETVDPELWVPWGYAVVRVDSRGAGRSPGYLDIFSPRETKDYYHAIEWAGTQSWSSGKVGLCGISYYAINQWHVAQLQPPHLTCMIPWEGAADFYREWARHGGILSNAFLEAWYPRQVAAVQHGSPEGLMDPWMNERSTGPAEFSKEELAKKCADHLADLKAHPLDDEYYRGRSPDWSKVKVPFLSAANWAGFGLHPRGNFEGFTAAASEEKWLECHPGRHEEWFYLPYGMEIQKHFLDYYLKGDQNGWGEEPRVWLNLRRPFSEEFELRKENEWPLARTAWTKAYLDGAGPALRWHAPPAEGAISFEAMGEAVTILSAPLEKETEITGPMAAKLFLSSTTADADLFLTFRAFSPEGKEVDFQGTLDPHTPLAQGWLRASQRKLDPARSRPWQPYHAHNEKQPLTPGEVYELDVEIWPTCIILPAGYQLALTIGGRDFERPPAEDSNEVWTSRGSGPWLHTDPDDRPERLFGGTTTIRTGGGQASYLLLPVVP